MRKYITCLIGILCIAFTSVCFAGKNVITAFRGELISVSVIHEDGTEYQIPGAKGPINLNNEMNAHATGGEGGDLPNGKYVAIKYVFRNNFTAAGKVILADGEYGSIRSVDVPPTFKKGQSPIEFEYKYPVGSGDWGWCTTNVSSDGELLEVIETDDEAHFTSDETKTFGVGVQLKWLWFGVENDTDTWADFRSSEYVKPEAEVTPGSGNEYFSRSDDDTICAPFIEPPEMEKIFN